MRTVAEVTACRDRLKDANERWIEQYRRTRTEEDREEALAVFNSNSLRITTLDWVLGADTMTFNPPLEREA